MRKIRNNWSIKHRTWEYIKDNITFLSCTNNTFAQLLIWVYQGKSFIRINRFFLLVFLTEIIIINKKMKIAIIFVFVTFFLTFSSGARYGAGKTLSRFRQYVLALVKHFLNIQSFYYVWSLTLSFQSASFWRKNEPFCLENA